MPEEGIPGAASGDRSVAPTPGGSTAWFFALVFALSVPFWIAGSFATRQLLPGVPVAALAVVCPALAASILAYRRDRYRGVRILLSRAFDCGRVTTRVWYLPALLLKPALAVIAYASVRAMGVPLPGLHVAIPAAAALFLGFYVAALFEEVGWSAHAVDGLQKRWSALGTALVVGLVWSVWHWVPLLQAERSLHWIAWWSLGTVTFRVLIVWIYNNAHASVCAAALCHASGNFSWQMFPENGSYWDPRVSGLLTALAAATVVVVWGPRSLTRDTGR